ncbi:MAG: DNA methyltransferase [Coleofasciculus sp. G1-WW12-02]|uniref:DNA methyltransferase n=1 Tax=Coleofasciculus sp. G1-WW12-02 TaxID=3068483 RepID=UPI003301DFAC
MYKQLTLEFANNPEPSPQSITHPSGYSGWYRLHKYWGKKPHEPLALTIQQLTQENDIILDPFVGSGTAARESRLRKRRFIGIDINPIATELTKLLISPPDYPLIRDAFLFLEKTLKPRINQTYQLKDGRTASHYLWQNNQLRQIWLSGNRSTTRLVLPPTPEDLQLIQTFSTYKSRIIRPPKFFANSRINASPQLSLSDLITGRAQHNLDLIIDHINQLPQAAQPAMKLCLTAASGQMTKMVFAVTGRGKTNGNRSKKIEVGSWVIGYWRPPLHFEVNVWNCFERRVTKLLNAIKNGDPLQGSTICETLDQFYQNNAECSIICAPCQQELKNLPKKSINLIITDPPHSDRIPYLELSELWNSILGIEPNFDSEIVISNAKERAKTATLYNQTMSAFFTDCSAILRDDGFLVLLYNARQQEHWAFIKQLIDSSEPSSNLNYLGQFPCNYSARSVVQDNRKGALKHDIALVFGNPNADLSKISRLKTIRGWSDTFPG